MLKLNSSVRNRKLFCKKNLTIEIKYNVLHKHDSTGKCKSQSSKRNEQLFVR